MTKSTRSPDRSPGFVWRLELRRETPRTFGRITNDRILLNMSVWETIEALRRFIYGTAHVELLRQRHEWFEKFTGAYSALWWVPTGHTPGIDEARKRLAYLDAYGPTQFAFTLQAVFEADEEFQRAIDWSSFEACPAV